MVSVLIESEARRAQGCKNFLGVHTFTHGRAPPWQEKEQSKGKLLGPIQQEELELFWGFLGMMDITYVTGVA